MTGRLGWHFSFGALAHGDGRAIVAGAVHEVEGPIVLCRNGLHASKRAIDALQYCYGSIVARVRVSGDLDSDATKFAGRRREYLAVIQSRPVLVEWALGCAERMLRYLPPGDDRPRITLEIARRYLRGEASAAELHGAIDAATLVAGTAAAIDVSARARARDADKSDTAAHARAADASARARAADVCATAAYASYSVASRRAHIAPAAASSASSAAAASACDYAAERAWQERRLVSLLFAAIRAQRREVLT